jgi:hypothetical protein
VPEQPKPRLAGPTRPLGAPEIPQFHLPAEKAAGKLIYAPRLYGAARILFADKKRGVNETRNVAVLLPLDAVVRVVDWETARVTDVAPAQLLADAPVKAPYLPLSEALMQVQTFTRWAKQFDRWLARTQRVVLTPKTDPAEPIEIAPKHGGVTVELVAIVWELTLEPTLT